MTMPDANQRPRPTIKDIARKAELSTATVSLALRECPQISGATRARVKALAKSMGYQRDPHISKLMAHLRRSKPSRERGTIVALYHPPFRNKYSERLIRGASEEAQMLGHKLVLQKIENSLSKQQVIERGLRNQGIETLLLLPSDLPLDLSHAMDWSRYSVVAAGHNPIEPKINTITSNWFHAIRTCEGSLLAKGYNRFGHITGVNWNYMSKDVVQAAICIEKANRSADWIPPFYYLPQTPLPQSAFICSTFLRFLKDHPKHPKTELAITSIQEGLLSWYERFRPDALILDREETSNCVLAILRARLPKLPYFEIISRSPVGTAAGVCLPAEEVGKRAVQLLDHSFCLSRTGIPEKRLFTMLDGQWLAANPP